MKNPIIEYPLNIRNLSGMCTVIFTHSFQIAKHLRASLSNEFQIIYHDLKLESEDKFDWLKEALFYSHIFVISDLNVEDAFACGAALNIAMEQNPELIIGIDINRHIKEFLKNFAKCNCYHFSSLDETINFIKDHA